MNCGFCGSAIAGGTRCRVCGRYSPDASTSLSGALASDAFVDMANVEASKVERIKTGLVFDDVWGGGFVPTAATLIAGPPGGGKTTLLLQLAVVFSTLSGKPAYYVCSEQANEELRFTLNRLEMPFQEGQFLVLKDKSRGANIGEDVFKSRPPGVIILDSLTDFCGLKDQAGQIALCKLYCTLSKKFFAPSFIISQMNKEGDTAGVLKIQHDVDTLIELEPVSDQRAFNRLAREFDCDVDGDLRAIMALKNRYGPTMTPYPLAMRANGLTGLQKLSDVKKSIKGLSTGNAIGDAVLARARLVEELEEARQTVKELQQEIADMDTRAEKLSLKEAKAQRERARTSTKPSREAKTARATAKKSKGRAA